MASNGYVRWFKDIRNSDVAMVGGKNALLGELYSTLAAEGILVPNGFALSAACYRDALTAAGAWNRLHALFDDLDKTDVAELSRRAAEARAIIYDATGTGEIRRPHGHHHVQGHGRTHEPSPPTGAPA